MQRFENVEPWEWRTYVEATGLRVRPDDVRSHLAEIERMPALAQQAWLAEQSLAIQPGRPLYLSDASLKRAHKAMQRGAETVVGKLLAKSEVARNSSVLLWWHAQSIVLAAE